MSACRTYLTTDELSSRIKYDSRTIRDRLKDSVLLEGRHYIRPFGGRKTLYIWEHIEADMAQHSATGPMRFLWPMEVCFMGSIRRQESKGTLFMDFRHAGQRLREYTSFADNAANRKALAKGARSNRGRNRHRHFDYQRPSASPCRSVTEDRSSR